MTDSSPLPPDVAAFVRELAGEEWRVEPLRGDASVRAYFRIVRPDGTTYMLAYYPEEVRPQLRRFLEAYSVVQPTGRIPRVLKHSEVAVLQHDVGDVTLFDILFRDREEGLRLYRRAVDMLGEFQRCAGPEVNPPFSADFFASELDMTAEFYVEKLMGRPSNDEGNDALKSVFRKLAEKIASHPYVLCHRDYHGQNIHVVNDDLFLIDYQDLRMGPDTYDVASLLRDRGVGRVLGDDVELDLVDHYARVTGAEDDVRRRYFETLLQRSIKILGTWAKQALMRGRLHYLDFIDPSLESVRRCLGELPEFAEVERVLPMQFDLDATRERLRKEQHGSAQDHASSR